MWPSVEKLFHNNSIFPYSVAEIYDILHRFVVKTNIIRFYFAVTSIFFSRKNVFTVKNQQLRIALEVIAKKCNKMLFSRI